VAARVTAVVLAIVSAALFGGMTVLVRVGLRQVPEARVATLATILPALAIALLAVALDRPGDLVGAWPFALAGLLAPGCSQIVFTLAVQSVGASRTSVIMGTAPLVAVAIALLVLHEPVSAPLLVGAVLVVLGGVALASERGRPEHLHAVGLAFAGAGVVMFATRDNLIRWLAGEDTAPPTLGAAATLLSATAIAVLYAGHVPDRRSLRLFLPAGICFGLSYLALFEAYYRGRVTVVSPLVATETLWGVGLSALLLRRSELVGRRLVLGAALIVAGGALIGVYR
jgi:drug/metabolite transporter (DMT)-like permease